MIGGMTGVLNDVIPYGLSIGNRNYLTGLNLIGLRRALTKFKTVSTENLDPKYKRDNVTGLLDAYNIIFSTKNLKENINKLNGDHKKNPLVNDVIEFIGEDKKRHICTPFSKE